MISDAFETTHLPNENTIRFSFTGGASPTVDIPGSTATVAKFATGKYRVTLLANTRPRKAWGAALSAKPQVFFSPKDDGTDAQMKALVEAYTPSTGVFEVWYYAPSAATCTITVDTNANMADGDYVQINTGISVKRYEYDKSANGVTAGNVTWAAGAGTAAQSAATLKAAIEGLTGQPEITVVDNLDGTLTLTNKWPGTGGNQTNSKSSASALAITNWTGGGVALTDPNVASITVVTLSGQFTQ